MSWAHSSLVVYSDGRKIVVPLAKVYKFPNHAIIPRTPAIFSDASLRTIARVRNWSRVLLFVGVFGLIASALMVWSNDKRHTHRPGALTTFGVHGHH